MNSAINVFENLDTFLTSLFAKEELLVEVELDVNCVGDPVNFKIELNNQVIHNNSYVSGTYQIILKSKQADKNCLSLELYNLNKIKDHQSFITISKFYINNYDILTDYDFFRTHIDYSVRKKHETPKPGFWNNACMKLNFDFPFSIWYHNTSNKSTSIAENLKYTRSMIYDKERKELLDKVKKLKL